MVNKYLIKKETSLENYLQSRGLSRKESYKLIKEKAITSEDRYLKEADTLKENTFIYINYSVIEDNSLIDTYKFKIDVLFENSEIIAIDKPQNILIHSDGNTNETLLNAVVNYLQEKGDDSLVRPLHRLDYKTKGVILFSKNILAHSDIERQINNNQVEKIYEAVAEGYIEKNQTIDCKIGRNRHDSHKFIVSPTGKYCHTEIEVISSSKKKSNLKVKITTGRTHQIRVSMAYINHPIVGDELYCLNNKYNKNSELMLLSKSIKFKLDNMEMVIYSKQKLW